MQQINYEYCNAVSLEKFVKQNIKFNNQKNILVQIFSSSITYEKVLSIKNELKALLKQSAIITTSSAGIVDNGQIFDEKIVLSFSLFEHSVVGSVGYSNVAIEDILQDLENNYICDDTKLVISFANTFKLDASNLLQQLALSKPNLMIVGGNAGDDFQYQSNYVSSNEQDDADIVFAVIDSKVLQVDTGYLFNLETIGQEMVVTRADGGIIYELDHIPTIDIFGRYLGKIVRDDLLQYGSQFPLVFKSGDIDVARALVAVDYENGSITFAGKIPEGTKVRFGFVDIDTIENKNIHYLKQNNSTTNEVTFVYACAARRQVLGGFIDKEIHTLSSIGPTSGFITYGEFFHNNSNCQNNLLNMTTTYVTLNEGSFDGKVINFANDIKPSNDDIRFSALTTLIKETSKDLDENIFYLQQFKNAVSSASIFSATDASGKITFANENFERISDYSKEELIGKPHSIVKHSDTEATLFKGMWSTIKAGNIWKGLIHNQGKRKNDYWVVSEIAPIYYKNGNFREYICIGNDVTELEIVRDFFENEMKSSKENLETNLNHFRQYEEAINLSTAVLRTNTDNVITYVNDKFIKLSKFTREELIGKNCEEIRHQKHRDQNQCKKIIKDLKSNKTVKHVMTNIAKDGSEFITNTLFYPIQDKQDEVVEFLQVMYDVTDIYKLNEEIINTQKEVVEKMGAIGETRSQETGEHVQRVAEYSYMLALLHGLSEEEATLLKQASPMHDIGKVGIPDNILNKPGKLTPQEFEIMKTHAQLGYDMLKHSNRDILKASAIVAYTHHEKWDGSGYPRALQGEDIPIFGRITAIADVFDALGHDRVYKKAWELDKILEFFKEQRGKHFDPILVDLFLENLDSFLKIEQKIDVL
ncbi:HD domain-containing phosphohydrolase [Sulfurimonas sp.]|uniref:HD domain-containing phosphohydrolase n=1 Tax=Sulfurimonas sp. TaxID=2022749 RepID=UPI003D12CE54